MRTAYAVRSSSEELTMHRLVSCLAVVATLAGTASAQTPASDVSKALDELRANLQAVRADVIAKNVTLSAAEAAKFWPMYEKYQAEQSVIMDAQFKGIKEYAANFENMDDARALAYIDSLLKRDEAMTALRRKWLPEFSKVVRPSTAVRVIQIDLRLGQSAQVDISSQVPLIR
jgi:hypothetical protein